MLLAGAASAGVVAYPDDSLGTLSPTPSLYGDLLATGKAAGGVFSDDFFFDLSGKSDVIGSVGMFFGTVSFSSVLIDGNALALTSTPTGYGFNFSGLAAGAHTLTVEGAYPKGGHAYVGSLYATPAVPEPESMALALAGLGVMGLVARRRQRN
ncbi:hypothetical protein JY96_08810 [Aquabacterium sp. NJ1]|nr:hypothetical protein JY96_08810 [Aquabacterium sp. NJ1]